MAGASISPPGVNVIQAFVSSSPTTIEPTLPTVIVGPCFQLVDAFDDLGNPQAEALAGTYRDGSGVVAYDLPNLISQASLVGFESSVRVFLLSGTAVRELTPASSESDILSGTASGSFTFASSTWTDATQLFSQVGVEAGDVVRLTYRDEVVDIPIVSVDTDTTLTLGSSVVQEDLAAVSYSIVRNAAEFRFDATAQANVEIGDAADYLRVSAAQLKTDGTTPGDYVGSAGDALSLSVTDSVHYIDGVDGAVGDSIFEAAGAFLTSVGPRGAVTGFRAQVGASGAAEVLRDVLTVVDNSLLIIESGEGALTGQDWVVGSVSDTGLAGGTDGAGTTFTGDALESFLTSIPNTAGTPDQTTLIEIGTDGVYAVSAVLSDTTLTIAAASAALVGQAYTIITAVAEGTADGATLASTEVVSVVQDLSAATTLMSVNVGGTEAAAITSVTSADRVTVGTPLTAGSGIAFSVVDTTADLTLSWDLAAKSVIVQLARTGGLSSSTLADIATAITTSTDASYNAVVADVVTAAVGGTTGTGLVPLTQTDVGTTLTFDGGADVEQLILGADLLGSTTPTAQVYVSYRALRLDVSDKATTPTLIYVDSSSRATLLGPAVAENPLGLAAEFAIQNSTTRGVYVLGVGEVTAAKPEGTLQGYIDAFAALESKRAWAIVPLTFDLSVARALQSHVLAMSASLEKAVRVGLFSSSLPTHQRATVIASGASGNSGASFAGTALAELGTSVDLSGLGIQAGDYLVVTANAGESAELSAVNGTEGPLYGVPVAGSIVKTGDNFTLIVDASAVTDTAWNSMVDVSWAVYRPGAAITSAVDQAEAIALVSESFGSRRMYHHWPDEFTADVAGTETLLPGYFLAACWGGRDNEAAPELGFSRSAVVGPLSLRHSNTYFSKSQLDRIAGGGTWITVQDSSSAPARCRHQLSTDVTSLETREKSITRVVDYVSYFLQAGLNRQVGRFNITNSYMDGLATAVQGLLRALVDSGKLKSAELISLGESPTTADKLDIVVSIGVAYPANNLEVTVQV